MQRNIPSCVNTCFLMCLSVDGLISRSQDLAVLKCAGVNMGVQYPCNLKILTLIGKIPGRGIAGSNGMYMLI